VRGNSLTGHDWRGEDIQLSWWNRDPGQPGVVRRKPFRFVSLREESMFDLAPYETYAPCPINQVHQEVKSDG